MQLPGQLSGTTLGDVLGALHRGRATGILRLTELWGPTAGRRHDIRLSLGLVSGVDSPVSEARLGELLHDAGVIDARVWQQAMAQLRGNPNLRLGHVLREQFGVAATAVSRALRRQWELRLESLFRLRDARISFHVATPLRAAAAMPLLAGEFLHGRMRARDRAGAASSAAARRVEDLRVLGLDAGASDAEIKGAFRALARRLHPDCVVGQTDAARFVAVTEAYRRLVSRAGPSAVAGHSR